MVFNTRARTPDPHPGHSVVTLTHCHRPAVSPRLCRDPSMGEDGLGGIQECSGGFSAWNCLIQGKDKPQHSQTPQRSLWILEQTGLQEEQPGRAGPPSYRGMGPHKISPSPSTTAPRLTARGWGRNPWGARHPERTAPPPKADTSTKVVGHPQGILSGGWDGTTGDSPKPDTPGLPGTHPGEDPPVERHYRGPPKAAWETPSTPERCGRAGVALQPPVGTEVPGAGSVPVPRGSPVPQCPPLRCVRVPPGSLVPSTSSYLPGDAAVAAATATSVRELPSQRREAAGWGWGGAPAPGAVPAASPGTPHPPRDTANPPGHCPREESSGCGPWCPPRRGWGEKEG